MSDTRDFLKLFLWQAERHADILATDDPREDVGEDFGAGVVECGLYGAVKIDCFTLRFDCLTYNDISHY